MLPIITIFKEKEEEEGKYQRHLRDTKSKGSSWEKMSTYLAMAAAESMEN